VKLIGNSVPCKTAQALVMSQVLALDGVIPIDRARRPTEIETRPILAAA
jgi:hypothetical protein